MLYFSFTTLTTVGYGDITPVNPFAMTLSNAEAIIGQLYPAIIGKLVSLLDELPDYQGTGIHKLQLLVVPYSFSRFAMLTGIYLLGHTSIYC